MNLPNIIVAGVLFIAISLGFFYYKQNEARNAGLSMAAVSQTEQLKPALSDWIKTNIADPEASIAEVSTPWDQNGRTYAGFRVRGRNKLGGWIFQDMVAEVHGTKVIAAWDVEHFKQLKP